MSVSTARVHGPSSRAELTARELGCIFWHLSYITPVSTTTTTTRVDGCQKMHPSSRAVNSARELGLWTRVVETDLYSQTNEQPFYSPLIIFVTSNNQERPVGTTTKFLRTRRPSCHSTYSVKSTTGKPSGLVVFCFTDMVSASHV